MTQDSDSSPVSARGTRRIRRDRPISDHTDMTWRQLGEMVAAMKADGRIPWQ